jgi:uncharacterized protein
MRLLRYHVLVIVLALLLAACSRSPAARFYILTPLPPPQVEQAPPGPAAQAWIKVLPVRIPDYLDRPQIVTFAAPNAIEVAEFDRWAGSLSENISAVVAGDLGAMLRSERVISGSAPAVAKADYSVALQVIRLEAVRGNQLLMEVRWAILQRGREDAVQHLGTFTEPLSDRRYQTVVAALSRSLARLSSEIANEIVARANAAPAAGTAR